MKKITKKSLLVALLANTLTLSGCVREVEDLTVEDLQVENIEEIDEEIIVENEVTSGNTMDYDYINELKDSFVTDITFKNQAYYDDIKFFDPITIEKCQYKFDGDVTKIIDTIEENSIKYASENNMKSWFDENYDKALTRTFLESIINNIILTSKDINEDMHIISQLKILNDSYSYTLDDNNMKIETSLLSKYNSNDRTIKINRDKIYNDYLLNGEVKENLFENNYYSLLYSAINESRLDTCEEINNEDSIYDNVGMLNALASGATKSNTYYDNKSGSSQCLATFKDDSSVVDEAKLLTLALLSNEENVTTNYYEALFDEDYEKLYEIFNLNNEEDITKFKKIILAMDSKNLKNDYMIKHGNLKNMVDAEEYVGYDYRVLLHNMVVNNLINNQDNLSLEDNLTLYHLMFSIVVKDAYIDKHDLNLDIYDDNFVGNMYELYNNYIKYLKLSYNVSDSEFDLVFEESINRIDELYTVVDENATSLKTIEFINNYPFSKIIVDSTNLKSTTYKDFFANNGLTLKK